ncbi:EAL domain-containing protein [bacterium]|nr:EAL domain-containing protein [bacterium]
MTSSISAIHPLGDNLAEAVEQVAPIDSSVRPSPQSLKLLLAHESSDSCDPIVEAFRDAGWSTRAHRLTSIEDFDECLKQGGWDIVLAFSQSTVYSLSLLHDHIQAQQSDVVTIYLDDSYSAANALTAMQNGCLDYLLAEEHDRLLFSVARELGALANRRRLSEAEDTLAEANARSQLLMDSSLDAIAYVADGMIVHVNQCFAERLKFDDAEALDCYPLIDLISADNQKEVKQIMRRYQQGELTDESSLPVAVIASDESEFEADLCLAQATFDGELCTQVILRTAVNTDLSNLAKDGIDSHDSNIESLLSITDKGSLFFITTDTSLQKQQELGFQNYPILLQKVQSVLEETLPSGSTVKTYERANWVAVVPEAIKHDIKQLAQSLCDNVAAQSFSLADQTINTSITVGVSKFGFTDLTPEIGLEKAFNAATEQQLAGGNGFKIFSPTLQNASGAQALQQALQHDRFRIQFEAIVSLQGDSKERYEVLPCLLDDEENIVSADSVLSELGIEKENAEFDRWLVVEATRKLKAHLDSGHDTQLMLPISASAMVDEEFLGWLAIACKASEVPAKQLAFSIRMKDVVDYHSSAVKFIKELNRRGHGSCICEIDAPNDKLTELAASYTKVAASVTEALEGEGGMEKMTQVIQALKASKSQCIMSAVASAGTLAKLWQTGVPFIQGAYMHSPSNTMEHEFTDMA